MAIEPIKGFYVHDEVTNTDGVAKYDYEGLENAPRSTVSADKTSLLEEGTIHTGLGSIGDTVDMTVQTSDNLNHCVIPCRVGETFTIIGIGATNPRLWAFTDTAYKLLKRSAAVVNQTEPLTLTADQDGYAIFNMYKSSLSPKSIVHNAYLDKHVQELIELEPDVSNLTADTYRIITDFSELKFKQGKLENQADQYFYRVQMIEPLFAKAGSTILIKNGYRANLNLYNKVNNTIVYDKTVGFSVMASGTYTFTQDYYFKMGVAGETDSDEISAVEMPDVADVNIITVDSKNLVPSSPYKRIYNYGNLVHGRYEGLQASYDVTALNVDYQALISQWDAMVSDYSNYVTKSVLGDSSYIPDGTSSAVPLYLYDFNPVSPVTDLPKIIIVAGMHGFEKGNAFGLYYLMKDVLENWTQSDVLAYLRNQVRIKIIPFANPFGFDTMNYYNQNQVNINRNFNSNWSYVEPGEQGSGDAPFDQPESQIIKTLIGDNVDAFLYIDSHSQGGGIISDYTELNVPVLYQTSDKYYNKLFDASKSHIANNTLYLVNEYSLPIPSNTMFGRVSLNTATGTSKSWVSKQGILGVTFEGLNGLPTDSQRYSSDAIKVNAEMLGNFIIQVINKYRE